MTKRASFTKAELVRAAKWAQEAGFEIGAISIEVGGATARIVLQAKDAAAGTPAQSAYDTWKARREDRTKRDS